MYFVALFVGLLCLSHSACLCVATRYQVELAAGGLPRKNIFKQHVVDLSNLLEPGRGFSINMLYLNAKQWGFQMPMIPQLVKEGYPIDSITVAAGVPTRERGNEILATLREVTTEPFFLRMLVAQNQPSILFYFSY